MSCQESYFQLIITNQQLVYQNLEYEKTNQMLLAFVWLVNIVNSFAFDWRFKNE